MGQKVNPIANRLGIIKGWDSNWYGGDNYGEMMLEDSNIRKYLNARLAKASVSRIVIERTLKLVTITICTARPGIIIGKGGSMLKRIGQESRKDIEWMLGCPVNLQLWIKIKEDWRNRQGMLHELGYDASAIAQLLQGMDCGTPAAKDGEG